MPGFELLREQWLLASFGGGLILVLVTVMSYLAIWRGRPDQPREHDPVHLPGRDEVAVTGPAPGRPAHEPVAHAGRAAQPGQGHGQPPAGPTAPGPSPGPAAQTAQAVHEATGRTPESQTEKGGDQTPPEVLNLLLNLPVILVFTYVVILIFMIVGFAAYIASPPNW